MSQPLFDPLDIAVLTRGLVPWTDSVLAAEADAQRVEMVQCTSDYAPWALSHLTRLAEPLPPVREVEAEGVGTGLKGWIARLSGFLNGPALGTDAAELAHGEKA